MYHHLNSKGVKNIETAEAPEPHHVHALDAATTGVEREKITNQGEEIVNSLPPP